MPPVKKGDRIPLSCEGREFDVIVIDPNGLGPNQPSVGFGYRMAEKYAGIPESTLRGWVREITNEKRLETPSGKSFRVRDILVSDGNEYSVIEASDWFALAVDVLVNPGRTGKGLRSKLGDFIAWFAVKGFYAEAYVAFKGVYTAKDSRATTQWLEARQLGVPTLFVRISKESDKVFEGNCSFLSLSCLGSAYLGNSFSAETYIQQGL